MTAVKKYILENWCKTIIGLNQYGYVHFIKSQLKRHYEYFSKRIGIKKETEAEQLAFVKNMFSVTESGRYLDYNFIDNKYSKIISTASFYPYLVGLASDKQSLKKLLGLLELEYGVSTCEYQEKNEYLQWDYPIMWALQMYFVYEALMKNGLCQDAKRIATKYIRTVERNFEETGILWEKYNAKTSGVGETKESKKYPMLGWSAAIYEYFIEQVNRLEK